jgi:GntR family transcriptional regulator
MRSGTEPLHLRLKSEIMDQVAGGIWPKHSPIASERELCKRYNVSRTTARRAIIDLVHEGLLYTVLGKGTFVAEPSLRQELKPLVGFTQDLNLQGIDIKSEVVEFRRIEADEELGGRFGVRVQSPIIILVRVRRAAGEPIALQRSYLPEHLCPGLLGFDLSEASLFQTLREEYKLVLSEASTAIKSGLATEAERKLLSLPDPSAVLRTFQTTCVKGGQVIEWCESVFHGDHFELTSRLSPEGTMRPLAQINRLQTIGHS